METVTQTTSPSKGILWTGRIISALVALFLLWDGVSKVFRAQYSVEGTVQMGYPDSTVVGIGSALVISTILYLLPRTSILGAILLTGYLGGATASMVRMGNFGFWFPVVFCVLAWVPLYLKERRLRSLIPLRKDV